jgi:hypothetical protein
LSGTSNPSPDTTLERMSAVRVENPLAARSGAVPRAAIALSAGA